MLYSIDLHSSGKLKRVHDIHKEKPDPKTCCLENGRKRGHVEVCLNSKDLLRDA